MTGSRSWKGLEWPYGPVAFKLIDAVETFLQMKSQAVKTDTEGWGGGGSLSEPQERCGARRHRWKLRTGVGGEPNL